MKLVDTLKEGKGASYSKRGLPGQPTLSLQAHRFFYTSPNSLLPSSRFPRFPSSRTPQTHLRKYSLDRLYPFHLSRQISKNSRFPLPNQQIPPFDRSSTPLPQREPSIRCRRVQRFGNKSTSIVQHPLTGRTLREIGQRSTNRFVGLFESRDGSRWIHTLVDWST